MESFIESIKKLINLLHLLYLSIKKVLMDFFTNIIKKLIKSCDCDCECNAKRFKQNFKNWTSGNNYIDKFIQDIQLTIHTDYEISNVLEWITYDRLNDIKEDEFGVAYRAKWCDGCIDKWDIYNQNWKRYNKNMIVTLKNINNPINVKSEFINEIKASHKVYGITQDPKSKKYMMIWNEICEKCNLVCDAKRFQQNFENWTSGNNKIDKFIQDTQLSAHHNVSEALEWIPYDRFCDIKCTTKGAFGNMYRASWIDGYMYRWDNKSLNWIRYNQNMVVTLKSLSNPANKVTISRKVYGITQDPETKFYMMVWNEICEKCKYICYTQHFQQNFENWTSGNNFIDKFIQDSQLLDCYSAKKALEWIPYNRLCSIKYFTKGKFSNMYKANWIDGYIDKWDNKNQSWIRYNQNMVVTLKSINNPTNIMSEFINEVYKICYLMNFEFTVGDRRLTRIRVEFWAELKMSSKFRPPIFANSGAVTVRHKIYGITQDPKTNNYMVVWNEICVKCNNICYTQHFQQNFENWTSGNNLINKFIQDSQLLDCFTAKKTLEWIPYNRFCNIRDYKKCKTNEAYKANWIDGCIYKWDNKIQNWERDEQNMSVVLNTLNNPEDFILKFTNEITVTNKVYGITKDSENNYRMVCNEICEKCNYVCYAKKFQQDFDNWTSGNSYIDRFIQDSQLSAHGNYEVFKKVFEWIPYKRFYDTVYITKDELGEIYRAKWIDERIQYWYNNNWNRPNQKFMFVILKSLNNSKNITLKFMNEITVPHKFYGITQDPKTKNYMIVYICKKCKDTCYTEYFQQNFKNWTSGNNDIDKFIQDVQTSYCYTNNVLEWIPYNKFYDIKYIAKGGFGKVYKAKWIDGCIDKWDNKHQNWERKDQNMFVALKNLDNSKNITLKFMNEIILHFKVSLNKCIIKLYGITQDPVTKNYIMVLDYAEHGSLRNYLNTCNNKLSWNDKINYLHSIAHGLKDIHEKELIHRDLHIGNILRCRNVTCITDMGLCKPADYNASENSKNSIYGVLPYIAPEILRGQNYTKAADIYSFGIIMYEVISGLPSYHDVSHDTSLAIKICKGLRPRFNMKVPQLIEHLINRCLDVNQLNRPKAKEIKEVLSQWYIESYSKYHHKNAEIRKQIKEAENINNSGTNLGIVPYKTHSEAIYASRLLDFTESLQINISLLKFNNLKPKNSDRSCKEPDNAININSTESKQANISQLENDNNNLLEPNNYDDFSKENDSIISVESLAVTQSLQIDIS
ncbi:hypothetical protein C1646_772594 [Rhizophagus diaphanus]|nr:hypothetical protein C1646_772594 [Rhizophagus diaphanus] [Rhizophagus sp. MUCL 43196]